MWHNSYKFEENENNLNTRLKPNIYRAAENGTDYGIIQLSE
jgi:hypothetical protein